MDGGRCAGAPPAPRRWWRAGPAAIGGATARCRPAASAGPGFNDLLFGVAQPRGAVDQGLIELAVIGADRLDLVLELGLSIGGLLLLGADRFELLVALAQRIEGGLGD